MNRWLRLLPVALLGLLLAALVWRLAHPEDTTIRSRLAGKPVPEFALPPAQPNQPGLASADLATGQPHLVNLFASWCVPCVAEAPVLQQLKARGVVIDGIAIRDRPEDLAAFLAARGNPFERIGADNASRVQLALGSAGVPESFVVDGRGIIRHQHVGPIEPADVPVILTQLEQAR
ncbi:MAG: DsbE family thiol:disulfide interchange protein [Sphingomicrobium sp.]